MFHRNRKPLPFADFPRSILVPPAEFRQRVENWSDFVEYLPADRYYIHGPDGPVTDGYGTLIGWNGPIPPELQADLGPVPRLVERRTYSSRSESGLGLQHGLHGGTEN